MDLKFFYREQTTGNTGWISVNFGITNPIYGKPEKYSPNAGFSVLFHLSEGGEELVFLGKKISIFCLSPIKINKTGMIYKHSLQSVMITVMIMLLPLTSCTTSPVEPVVPPVVRNDTLPSPGIEMVYPVPSESQLEWQDSELVMFIHFGMNTFTDSDYGTGAEHPSLFNPPAVNVKQWVSVAKEAGFKYLILTAKHHDGFCLWPSEQTEHSVKNSPYKNGQGDIVKEFADECRAQGVKFGYYLSIWDMNSPVYGTNAYNAYYLAQTLELCTKYGEVGEIWLDGFLGRNPSVTHSQFDWLGFAQLSKSLQPKSLMAIMGPDIRWVGNEDGVGSETDWSFTWSHTSHHGIGNVEVWWPTECDVSIRPSWFYHDYQDPYVKTPAQLVDLYLKSVGRNSNLLLNVPPMRDGNFNEIDVASLKGFRTLLNEIFALDLLRGKKAIANNSREGDTLWGPSCAVDGDGRTFWVTDHGIKKAELEVDLGGNAKVNYLRIEEAIRYGQRVRGFEIQGQINGSWVYLTEGTTIGRSRILKLEVPMEVTKLKLVIKDSRGAPAIRTFSAFYYNK